MGVKEICGFCVYIKIRTRKTIETWMSIIYLSTVEYSRFSML